VTPAICKQKSCRITDRKSAGHCDRYQASVVLTICAGLSRSAQSSAKDREHLIGTDKRADGQKTSEWLTLLPRLKGGRRDGTHSWHKNRVFISEVFRFEELGFELITPGCYRVFFRDMEIGELNAEELRFIAARRVV
jgi:hypothetical protein